MDDVMAWDRHTNGVELNRVKLVLWKMATPVFLLKVSFPNDKNSTFFKYLAYFVWKRNDVWAPRFGCLQRKV